MQPCAYCNQFSEDCLTLKCGHTFCAACRRRSATPQKCNDNKQAVRSPSKSPSSPTLTRKNNSLLRENKCVICAANSPQKSSSLPTSPVDSDPKSRKKCSNKKCEREATLYCKECNRVFCNECSELIHEMLDDHRQRPLLTDNLCDKHSQPISALCNTCQILLCNECRKGSKHTGHEIVENDTFDFATSRKNIQATIADVSASKTDIADMMKKIDLSYSQLDKTIHTQFKELGEIVIKRRDKLLQQAYLMKEKKRKNVVA
jgi:hypothetical protein